jgi:hypothetical protein
MMVSDANDGNNKQSKIEMPRQAIAEKAQRWREK